MVDAAEVIVIVEEMVWFRWIACSGDGVLYSAKRSSTISVLFFEPLTKSVQPPTGGATSFAGVLPMKYKGFGPIMS